MKIIRIRTPFAKERAQIKSYFKRPLIVVSKTFPPAILIMDFKDKKGNKYVRVQLKNRPDSSGRMPLTDIPSHLVEKVYKGNSPFMRWLIKINLLPKDWMVDDNKRTK